MWVYIWLGITALALIVEFITSEIVSVWFAGGGLIAMILAILGVGWYITLPVFIVLSVVFMLCFRKIAMRYFLKGDAKTNADIAIGQEFTLLSDIEFGKSGTIKVNDVVWNVITENEHEVIKKGKIVVPKYIKGNKYVVEEKKWTRSV